MLTQGLVNTLLHSNSPFLGVTDGCAREAKTVSDDVYADTTDGWPITEERVDEVRRQRFRFIHHGGMIARESDFLADRVTRLLPV